jgi:alanine dehydrogenase
MKEDYEHATQMEAVGEATAQHHFAVGILKGNSLTPRKEVVIPPYSVETLVENHVPVRTERGMGKGADFIDLDYADAGALIEDEPKYVFQKSDILISLRPLTAEELNQLKDNQILITPIPLADITPEHLAILHKKNITALSLRLVHNVEDGELLQDIIHVEGGIYAACNALGDWVLSLIFPLVFNSEMRYALQENPVLMQAIYCYKGILTRHDIGERHDIPWRDLLLLCW